MSLPTRERQRGTWHLANVTGGKVKRIWPFPVCLTVGRWLRAETCVLRTCRFCHSSALVGLRRKVVTPIFILKNYIRVHPFGNFDSTVKKSSYSFLMGPGPLHQAASPALPGSWAVMGMGL